MTLTVFPLTTSTKFITTNYIYLNYMNGMSLYFSVIELITILWIYFLQTVANYCVVPPQHLTVRQPVRRSPCSVHSLWWSSRVSGSVSVTVSATSTLSSVTTTVRGTYWADCYRGHIWGKVDQIGPKLAPNCTEICPEFVPSRANLIQSLQCYPMKSLLWSITTRKMNYIVQN